MPCDDESGSACGGAACWVRRWWRALAAEVLATALLVLMGVASLLPRQLDSGEFEHPPLAHPALAFGFIVLANVQIFGGTSGAHMNPAVTLTAMVARQLPAGAGAAYVAAQAAGAVLGYTALGALHPALPQYTGLTLPAPGVSRLAATVVEALLTGILVLLCCSLWAAPTPDPAAAIKLGLTVAGLVYAGGYMTGASLNPVRSLAPAIFHNNWTAHWVYWVGPLAGAALAAGLHALVLAPRPPSPARAAKDAPEELPLHDKAQV